MVTGLGAITMAAHEILRQVWIISIQGFMALDITAQSLVASYLGQVRTLQLYLRHENSGKSGVPHRHRLYVDMAAAELLPLSRF